MEFGQILLARGATRLSLNCNGWLPLDVAKMWGRHWLEPLLQPNSVVPIPTFPSSNYLSLPLMSVLNIARDYGLQSTACEDSEICAVCLERPCSVAAQGCGHQLCVRCGLYLCSTTTIPSESSSIPCPLCRRPILSFLKLPVSSSPKETKLPLSLTLCTPCMLHHTKNEDGEEEEEASETIGSPQRKKRVDSISSDTFCPVTCSPFHSVALPLCTCAEGPFRNFDSRDSGQRSPPEVQEKVDGMRLEKTTCSSMFWGRRSCSRENQCNAEINT